MSEAVRVILNTTMEDCPLAKICTHSTTVVPSFLVCGGTAGQEADKAVPKQMTPTNWAEAQMQDWDLSHIIWPYKNKQLETAKLGNFDSREIKALLYCWGKLTLQEGVLHLKTDPNWDDWNGLRLVLPQAYCTLVMHGCHDDLGNLGNECMLDLLHDQFYWSTMQDDMDQHLSGCDHCKWFKPCPQQEELHSI